MSSGSFYRNGLSLTTSLRNKDVQSPRSSTQSDMNSKLDNLVTMVAEQKKSVETALKSQSDMKKEISEIRETVQAFKQQLEKLPVDKSTVAVKKKIPTDLSVCVLLDYIVCSH